MINPTNSLTNFDR